MHPFSLAFVSELHASDIATTVRSFRPTSKHDEHALLSAAHAGLVEAHRTYDPAASTAFWSYAFQRVRGAILDERRLGRRWSRRRAREREAARLAALSVDASSPEDAFLLEESKAQLAAEVERLPPRERLVLRGFYFEDRCLDDLGAELGASRSWVSRIHTRGLRMLRERMSL